MNIYIGTKDNCRVGGLQRNECKNLLCQDCGIRVIKFDGYSWKEDQISYLFFRANFGDFDRLKQGMSNSSNSSVFSCGCKGVTITKGTKLDSSDSWKCTGCPL